MPVYIFVIKNKLSKNIVNNNNYCCDDVFGNSHICMELLYKQNQAEVVNYGSKTSRKEKVNQLTYRTN